MKVAPFAPPKVPSIAIVKSPKIQKLTTEITSKTGANGAASTSVDYGTANFTIKATNTGNDTLHDVVVNDPLSPDCSHTIGDLAPGASTSYACERATVSASFINIAKVTGKGSDGKEVSDVDHAKVVVTVKTTATSGAKFAG